MIRFAWRSFFALAMGVSLAGAAPAGPADPHQAVRDQVAAVARDYLESWYTADPDRMAGALHPDMVKRYIDSLPTGRQVVHSVTRDLMVEMTRAGGGSKMAPAKRNIAVDVLEVAGDIAVARASSSQYLEYLSLAKCNGQWRIINILWRFQDPAAGPRP